MSRLIVKTEDFSPGKKVFVNVDGETLVSDDMELPEGFIFGIEVPEDSGKYSIQTVVGTVLVIVRGQEVTPTVMPWVSTSGTGNDYVFNNTYDDRLTQKAGLFPVIVPLDVAVIEPSGYRVTPLTEFQSYWSSPTHATHFEAGDLFVFYNGAFAVNKNTYELEWIFYEEYESFSGPRYAFPDTNRTYGSANSCGNEDYIVGMADWGTAGLYVLKTQTGEVLHRVSELYSLPYVNEGINIYPSGQNNKFFLFDGGGWSGEPTPQVYILEIDEEDEVTVTLHPESLTESENGDYLLQPRLFMAAKDFFADRRTGEYYYSSGDTLTKFNADDSVAWYIDYYDEDFDEVEWWTDGWGAFCVKRNDKIIVFSRWVAPLIIDDATGEWELAEIDPGAMVTGETSGFVEFSVEDFWDSYELEIPRMVSDEIRYLPVLSDPGNTWSDNFVELFVVDLDTFNVREVATLPGVGDSIFYNQSGWPTLNHNTGVAYIRLFNRNNDGDNLYRLVGWSNDGVVSNIVLSYWDHSGTNGFMIEEHTPSLMLLESGDLLVHIDRCIAKYGDDIWVLNTGQEVQLSAGEWYMTKDPSWDPGVPLFEVGLPNNSCITCVYGELNSRYMPYSARTLVDTTDGSGIFNISQLPGFSATSSSNLTNLFPTGTPHEYLSTPRVSGTVTSAVIRNFNLETGDVTDFSLPNITTGLTNASRYIRESTVMRPNGNIVFLYHKVWNSDAPELRMFEYDGVSWSAKANTIYAAAENNPNVPIGNSGYRRHVSVYHNDKVYSILFKRVSEDDFHVREYDFDTNTWTEYDSIPVPQVPINRLSISAAYRDGKVYFTNGYVYDIDEQELTQLPNFPFVDNSGGKYITFRNNCVIILDWDLILHVYALENTVSPY